MNNRIHFNGGALRGTAGLTLLALAVAGCAGRGVGEHATADVPPPTEGIELQIEYGAERGELVLATAPVDLPAAGGMNVPQPAARTGTLPLGGWVHGYTVELIDSAGRTVPRHVLHHVNLILPGRRELFSPIMQRLGAAGEETAPVEIPRLLGVPVKGGDQILLDAMLHNPMPDGYEGVRVRVRIPFTPEGTRLRPLRVFPFYVDVMPPAGVHAYDLPPGRSRKSWQGRPAVGGRILGVGGHLHRYALSLRFEDVTENRLIWEGAPILDENGNVVGMPQDAFWWRLGLRISADHTYRLTTFYDNPTGRTIREGAMGALGGIFRPDRSVAWPAVDVTDPQYQLDIQTVVHGGVHGHYRGGEQPEATEPAAHEHDGTEG